MHQHRDQDTASQPTPSRSLEQTPLVVSGFLQAQKVLTRSNPNPLPLPPPHSQPPPITEAKVRIGLVSITQIMVVLVDKIIYEICANFCF